MQNLTQCCQTLALNTDEDEGYDDYIIKANYSSTGSKIKASRQSTLAGTLPSHGMKAEVKRNLSSQMDGSMSSLGTGIK